jgi:hypothetical protein
MACPEKVSFQFHSLRQSLRDWASSKLALGGNENWSGVLGTFRYYDDVARLAETT